MIGQKESYLRERWHEFWHFKNHDRPLIAVCSPRKGASPRSVPPPEDPDARWLDADYVVASARADMERTFYGGEAFPALSPNLGPDIVGAVCGCGIRFGADTSWAEPCAEDWNNHPEIVFDSRNRWWQAILRLTEHAAADARGDYLVGVTDLHPGADALVSLRGAEGACLDTAERREQFLLRTEQVFGVYKEMFTRLCRAIGPQAGCTNWMGVLHPEKNWYVTSCDFACLVSERDFNELVVPGLIRELEFLGASIFHLDGPGALRHLDSVLKLPRLNGVQWVPGSGQAPMRNWIPVLQKIQRAGKLIQAYCEADDIPVLCEALRPEGVFLRCWVQSEDEAKSLLALAAERSVK